MQLLHNGGLNAFIRAKATDGDYAKHLGIIAAVRRDFGQLTSLMGLANDGKEQLEESQRLAEEMQAGVVRFLDRMATEPDVRLTQGEVRSLLKLLEPTQALELVAARHEQLAECLEGEDAVKTLEDELSSTRAEPLPKFSRIVLYIDDLDRCRPQVVVDVLRRSTCCCVSRSSQWWSPWMPAGCRGRCTTSFRSSSAKPGGLLGRAGQAWGRAPRRTITSRRSSRSRIGCGRSMPTGRLVT